MARPDAALTVDAFVVRPGDSLRSALERMTLNRRGVVFVCDHDRHLIGALADGDVRRSLLDDTVLEAPVGKVMNTDPVLSRTFEEAEDLLHRWSVVAVPVVSDVNELTAIVVSKGDGIEVLEADVVQPRDVPDEGAVAIIPARGGSRRLPRKNLALLAHRPLLVWAIEAALSAERVRRVIVSTDDEEIAAAARSAGAEVPWFRPAALAADDSPTIAVLDHAMEWLRSIGEVDAPGVLLEPTSPIRPTGLIDEVIALLGSSGADSVATVAQVPHTLHPDEQLLLAGDGSLAANVDGRTLGSRRLRDEQTPTFVFTGQVYAFRPSTILEKLSIFGDTCLPVIRPWHEFVDIDEAADLVRAENTLRGSVPTHP